MVLNGLLMVLLGGCATDSSSYVVCGTLYYYPTEVQMAVADEVEQLPVSSKIPMFMGDYAAVRAEIKACKEKK